MYDKISREMWKAVKAGRVRFTSHIRTFIDPG
jgi:hypothetical protein